jgi:cytochrome bd-type quinol oxidase subunit 2
MNHDREDRRPRVDPETLSALSGLSAGSGMAAAQRARRSVREAVIVQAEERGRSRQNLGIALLALAALFILLSPVIWSGLDELMAGEHIFDFSAMMTMLALALATAVCAALIAGWRRQGKRPL